MAALNEQMHFLDHIRTRFFNAKPCIGQLDMQGFNCSWNIRNHLKHEDVLLARPFHGIKIKYELFVSSGLVGEG